jgi:glyoxylase-like metal-dependent hydrolase (beta-lactamase superfamily II)
LEQAGRPNIIAAPKAAIIIDLIMRSLLDLHSEKPFNRDAVPDGAPAAAVRGVWRCGPTCIRLGSMPNLRQSFQPARRRSGQTRPATIRPGETDRLSGRVRRITAQNPGAMTGPGTNTYLVGGADDLAVIDPGPLLDSHVDALLAAAAGGIRRILVTHTHLDHSPAAARLKAATGAELLGMEPPSEGRQDRTFRPDRVLADGARVAFGDCTLRAIHTPGHASNQLCYLLEEERLLFTGDHIMQGSTVVIDPPDGDMAQYLASLSKLKTETIARLAPGHGFPIDTPDEAIEALLRHRTLRERKIVAKLGVLGTATLQELVPPVYDDVAAGMHPWAARSLLAHLLKLEADGAAVRQGERWRPSATAAEAGAAERPPD